LKKLKASVIALVLFAVIAFGGSAYALKMSDIIGVVGGGFLVETIADPLNDFINTITFNKGVASEDTTKVVPIVSAGQGTRIGAAQVAGPKSAVDRTKAVARIDAVFKDRFRIEILIPIDSLNPLERFKRVQGVGISAVIDYKL